MNPRWRRETGKPTVLGGQADCKSAKCDKATNTFKYISGDIESPVSRALVEILDVAALVTRALKSTPLVTLNDRFGSKADIARRNIAKGGRPLSAKSHINS